MAQLGANNVLRLQFDRRGVAEPNGKITSGLCCAAPRGVAFSSTGELFVTQCCGVSTINRFLFDASGNAIANGVISGGLDNPQDLAFNRSGELFVANADSNSISRFQFDAAGHAIPHGQITGASLSGPAGIDFSPWGELFVGNAFLPGGVSPGRSTGPGPLCSTDRSPHGRTLSSRSSSARIEAGHHGLGHGSQGGTSSTAGDVSACGGGRPRYGGRRSEGRAAMAG